MKDAKIIPVSGEELADIWSFAEDVSDNIESGGMIALKCFRHFEYGDVILITGTQDGGLLIHA